MDSTSIFDLDLKGRFISIFSDKASYYIIFLNDEDKQAYIVITNKYFEVENLYDIFNSKDLFESKEVIFTRPFNDNFNEFVFKGFLKKENDYYRFSIENYRLIVEEEKVDYNDATKEIEDLREFNISHFIQKKNFIYFIGFDKETNEDVFVVFDLIKRNIKYLNSFYSDEDFIILKHFCFDENNIIICGYKKTINEENIPFLTYLHNPVR